VIGSKGENMRRFVLIDLWSQIEYIPIAVRRFTSAQFVDWLRQYGEVRAVTVPLPNGQSRHGYFTSPYGPQATFVYDEPGSLFLVGDHWFYEAWKPENAPK
jgi:hypothetical protein